MSALEDPGVVQWMKQTRDGYKQLGIKTPSGDPVQPLEAWLLEHGELASPRIDLPAGVEWMEAKMCFANAFALSAHSDRFTYMEGFAYTPGLIACHHAWVVDKDGNVIDPTWMDGGKTCPYCLGNKQINTLICYVCEKDQELCDHDPEEDGYYEEELDCWACKGTGESEFEHPSREGCSYYGIKVERLQLIALTLKKGSYGLLPDCIDDLEV